MGADEKHAATYHGGQYTPDVDDLRDLWVDRKLDPLPRAQGIELVPTVQAEFDRWLETVRAEAKAEALRGTLPDGAKWFPAEGGITYRGKTYYPADYVITRKDIAALRAEAKADALREAAGDLFDWTESPFMCLDECGNSNCPDDIRLGAGKDIQKWLRARANQYRVGSE